jgi:serine protease AprX
MSKPEKLGRLLVNRIGRAAPFGHPTAGISVGASVGPPWSASAPGPPPLPIVIKADTIPPRPGENWSSYSKRVAAVLAPIKDELRKRNLEYTQLLAANAFAAIATPDEVEKLTEHDHIRRIELDPMVYAETLDDVPADISLPAFRAKFNPGGGQGVKLAVLDSGVDDQHPHLRVAAAVQTCGESISLPGRHGTHCAGIIASQDAEYRGVAPGVELLNVKVLTALGQSQHTSIVRGIDEALDMKAEVLSMSLGFNHLPTWSEGGHGWMCDHGHCPLCTAVDNAVGLDGVVVVVAAGNEHQRAETLRAQGQGQSFDSEIACPGQARLALTVGAVTKRSYLPAPFSSRGPTADRRSKPDLVAAGVNITSTSPAPRDANGKVVPGSPRSSLFVRLSGTSMATPIVAGAAALIISERKAHNQPWNAAQVRDELLSRAVVSMPESRVEIGMGRLDLAGI